MTWRIPAYPPRLLRILFNHALLAAIGLADVGVWPAWHALYPVLGMQDFDDYAADAADVAHALLYTPVPKFGGKTPQAVIGTTPQEWAEAARRVAQSAGRRKQVALVCDQTPRRWPRRKRRFG